MLNKIDSDNLLTETNEVRIEIATTCNARCGFCPHHTDSFTRPKKVMSTEDYKYYLDSVLNTLDTQITDIGFSGFGEIFTDKNILDKLRYANTKGKKIHILTNGSLLTEEIMDELFKLDNIKDIRISIHTSNSENYESVMNYRSDKYTYDLVKKNIEYLINNKPDKLDLILTAVIDPNIHTNVGSDVDELIKEYNNRCYLDIWQPHNWVYGKQYREPASSLELRKTSCGRPFNGPIEILNNGDVNMCCFDYDSKMSLGNLNKESLEEIYTTKPYTNILHHHKHGTCSLSNLLCKDCDQLNNNEDVLIYTNRTSDKKSRLLKTSTNMNTLI